MRRSCGSNGGYEAFSDQPVRFSETSIGGASNKSASSKVHGYTPSTTALAKHRSKITSNTNSQQYNQDRVKDIRGGIGTASQNNSVYRRIYHDIYSGYRFCLLAGYRQRDRNIRLGIWIA